MNRILALQALEAQQSLSLIDADSTSSYEGCQCSTTSWSACPIKPGAFVSIA